MYSRYFYILFLTLSLSSCFTTEKTEKVDRNIAYIYNPNSSFIHPEYSIYHKSDTSSDIYIKINTSELLFNQANPTNQLTSHILFHYELLDINDTTKRMADTAKYDFEIPRFTAKNYITQMTCKAKVNNQYLLRIFMYDLMRNYWVQSFVEIDKTTKTNSQNFRMISMKQKMIVLNNIVSAKDTYRIDSKMSSSIDNYFIRFYKKRERYSPLDAGFSTEILQHPDSSWIIRNKENVLFTFPKEGSYVINTDTTTLNGLLVHQFGNNFPEIRSANEMLAPLAYLTSIDEYRQIVSSQKIKTEIDNFWIKVGTSTEKARELIKIYYNRIKYANIYFTSDREGWKTDRGMIFTLFGPPTKLYKSNDEEKWIYMQNNLELPFVFKKRMNPYSTSDYSLITNNKMESTVDDIIDLWVQGKVLFQ